MKITVAVLAGIVFGFVLSFFANLNIVGLKESWSMGYKTGKRDALSLSPVSDDLEMTCAGLWFGSDGAPYWKAWKEKNLAK